LIYTNEELEPESGQDARELEEEFGRDVEAAAEAERGKLETRRQKIANQKLEGRN
jgi:hypothetical protein